MIKILLVDDQQLVRAGIKSLLDLSDEVEVVSQAEHGKQAITILNEQSIDVVLLDLSMPVMDGLTTLKTMKEMGIEVPVIILTTFDDHQLILQGLMQGAKGYLLKDVSLDILIDNLKRVHHGELLLQPTITHELFNDVKNVEKEFVMPEQLEQLSKKELEVLGLMARGYSNKEISDILCKSEGTVKNHVSNILTKLNVRDRTRAVLLAIEKKILQ